jgi:hypothetical protein
MFTPSFTPGVHTILKNGGANRKFHPKMYEFTQRGQRSTLRYNFDPGVKLLPLGAK